MPRISSVSFRHRWARGRNRLPASVSSSRLRPLPRTNSGVPTSSSRVWSRADRVGWVMYSAWAAAVMDPQRSTVRKVSISISVMAGAS